MIGPLKKRNRLLKIFLSTLYLSAFTFGGGYVIVPLMKKRFVEELGWIDEQEMLDMTALAQSSPGAIAVNAATFVGSRVAGFAGAALATFGVVLPAFVIVSLLSVLPRSWRTVPAVQYAFFGLRAGVAALMLKALGIGFIVRIAGDLCRDRGEESAAGCLETAGKIEILLLCLPLFGELLDLIREIVP